MGRSLLLVGLRGPYSLEARAQAVLLGLLGTLLLNLARMAAVALVATWGGFVPAVVFHDYGGTALIVLWLFAFWFAATRWILGERLRPASPDTSPGMGRTYHLIPERPSTSVTIPSRIFSPASQKSGLVMSMPMRLTSSSGLVEPPAARNSRYCSTNSSPRSR